MKQQLLPQHARGMEVYMDDTKPEHAMHVAVPHPDWFYWDRELGPVLSGNPDSTRLKQTQNEVQLI